MEREFFYKENETSTRGAIIRGADGFSLMEMMVAIGLSAILLMGVTSMNSLTSNSMNTMHAVLYRDEIVKMIQQLSSSPMALKNTVNYASNTDLHACAYPPGPAGVPNPGCTQNTEYPVILLDTMGSPVSGAAAISIIDLTQSGSPLFYSVLDGSLCKNAATGLPITAATNVCAFEVVTSFIPTCADSGNCQDAGKIAFSFQYRVKLTSASGLNPLSGTTLKPVIAPPAPLSYVNAMTVRNGFFTN